MAGEDIIMVSQRELKRLHIIQKVLNEKLSQVEAGEILLLSDRQIRRIVSKIRQEGDKGIRHGLRGKPSSRMLPKKVKEKAIKFYREKYKGFGPTLLSEKLLELEGIKISKETLRNWLIETGDWKKVRKSRTHRQLRERKHYYGEMVQMDGSHHDWLEGRGPELVLMAYIDDATNTVFARFYDYEGTIPAMESFKHYIEKYGIPISVYLDRHSTYKSTGKPTIEDELANKMPKSLFETLQDRLIKEMRLKGIRTKDEANEFLKHYLKGHNKRFVFKPAKEGDLHRGIPKDADIDRILCIKTKRTLRNDFTISHDGNLYQITERVNGKEVIVEERVDGSMHIICDNRRLKFEEITSRPVRDKVTEPKTIQSKPKKVYIPPKNHPWKRYPVINRYRHKDMRETLLTETS